MSRNCQFASATVRSSDLFPLTLAIVCASIAFLSGCGGGGQQKPTFPVTGSVFSAGKPLAGGMVTLHPVEKADPKDDWPNGYPRATVQADGKLVFATYAASDGVPAGKYVVLLQLLVPCTEPPEDDPETDRDEDQKPTQPLCDKFQGQYSEPTSSAWKVTVEDKPLEIPRIELP